MRVLHFRTDAFSFFFSPANHYAPKGIQDRDKICANIRQQLSLKKRNRDSLTVLSGRDGVSELQRRKFPTQVSNTSAKYVE